MKKGDRVKLNPTSRYNDGDICNPLDIFGTIGEQTNSFTELEFSVAWDNGEINSYNEEDLILQDQPSFDRTAIATQILSGMMPQRQIVQIQSKKEEIVSTAIELADELIKQLSVCQN